MTGHDAITTTAATVDQRQREGEQATATMVAAATDNNGTNRAHVARTVMFTCAACVVVTLTWLTRNICDLCCPVERVDVPGNMLQLSASFRT